MADPIGFRGETGFDQGLSKGDQIRATKGDSASGVSRFQPREPDQAGGIGQIRPLAREAQAIALRTIVTIAALERMVIVLGANAFAATVRSRLSFWKWQYGARSATF